MYYAAQGRAVLALLGSCDRALLEGDVTYDGADRSGLVEVPVSEVTVAQGDVDLVSVCHDNGCTGRVEETAAEFLVLDSVGELELDGSEGAGFYGGGGGTA
jgi:hypothetical protein